jgi:hypothetical protein
VRGTFVARILAQITRRQGHSQWNVPLHILLEMNRGQQTRRDGDKAFYLREVVPRKSNDCRSTRNVKRSRIHVNGTCGNRTGGKGALRKGIVLCVSDEKLVARGSNTIRCIESVDFF